MQQHAAKLLREKKQHAARPAPASHARCWVCDEMDEVDRLPVRCGCSDRQAHAHCLEEWVSMLDGSDTASFCVACNKKFTCEPCRQ